MQPYFLTKMTFPKTLNYDYPWCCLSQLWPKIPTKAKETFYTHLNVFKTKICPPHKVGDYGKIMPTLLLARNLNFVSR